MVDVNFVQKWLETKCPSIHCPACGGKNFEVDKDLAMTNSIAEGRINYLYGFSLIVVTCNNCAYVMFLSAKKVGT